VSHFRVFGYKCFILKKGKLDKFEARSSDGIFFGYANHSRAFGILPPRLFHFMVFLMRILLVVESRGSLLLVLVSFLGPRWFCGLPARILV
jgi:hypothetical protein